MTAGTTEFPAGSAPAPPSRAAIDAAAFVARYRWWILLGLITSAIMEVLDTTIVNVALPQMAGIWAPPSRKLAGSVPATSCPT